MAATPLPRAAVPPRLTVVVSHPIQYQAPLWRAIAQDGRLALRVLYLSRHGVEARLDQDFGQTFAWDVDLLAGHDHAFVPNLRAGAQPGGFLSHVNPGLPRALARSRPDAVLLVGARNPSALAGLAWARARRVPTLYRADSNVAELEDGRPRRLARAVLRTVDGVLVIGSANDAYYAALGVGPERRHPARYSVDNAFFQSRAVPRDTARAGLGLPADDELVALFAGKLTEHKDPFTALEACAAAARDAPRPIRLLVAGDGALRGDLEARAREAGARLTVLGFRNQTEMASVYSAADVLVLPSRAEPWGLVVNEAMSVGVGALCSTAVGAHRDLVRPGETGATFAPGDAAALAAHLRTLAADPGVARRWGDAARELIGAWDLAATVDGVVAAVHAVTAPGTGRRASP